MAPDLNSVPPSPRAISSPQSSTASSRRVSQPMAPPPVPNQLSGSAANGREAYSISPVQSMPNGTLSTNTNVSVGPGPLRHPRPLTAAELHLQLEKEQEAVVNRLTRELVLLRQQTASVASTTSSTSTGLPDVIDHGGGHAISGPFHPTASRRHRSSSNLSTQSMNLTGVNASTVSGIAPARDAGAVPFSQGRGQPSRHDSTTSSRRSETSSPSLASSLIQGDHFPLVMNSRHASTNSHGHNAYGSLPTQPVSPRSARSPHRTTSASSTRFEEVTHHRAELDSVRRENENLRRRIQDLERQLNDRSRHTPADINATRHGSLPRE